MKLVSDLQKYRCQFIDEALGWAKFCYELRHFMGTNNFSNEQIDSIVHLLNGLFYFQPKLEPKKDS